MQSGWKLRRNQNAEAAVSDIVNTAIQSYYIRILFYSIMKCVAHSLCLLTILYSLLRNGFIIEGKRVFPLTLCVRLLFSERRAWWLGYSQAVMSMTVSGKAILYCWRKYGEYSLCCSGGHSDLWKYSVLWFIHSYILENLDDYGQYHCVTWKYSEWPSTGYSHFDHCWLMMTANAKLYAEAGVVAKSLSGWPCGES